MNWMGGARSRIRHKGEKKIQKQFFERKKLMKTTPIIERGLQTPVGRKSRVSQDLKALYLLNQIHSSDFSPPNDCNRQVRKIEFDKPKSSKFHPPKDLGSSPFSCAPSKLLLMEPKYQREGKFEPTPKCLETVSDRNTNPLKPHSKVLEFNQRKQLELYNIFGSNSKEIASERKMRVKRNGIFVSEDFQPTPVVKYFNKNVLQNHQSAGKISLKHDGKENMSDMQKHNRKREDDNYSQKPKSWQKTYLTDAVDNENKTSNSKGSWRLEVNDSLLNTQMDYFYQKDNSNKHKLHDTFNEFSKKPRFNNIATSDDLFGVSNETSQKSCISSEKPFHANKGCNGNPQRGDGYKDFKSSNKVEKGNDFRVTMFETYQKSCVSSEKPFHANEGCHGNSKWRDDHKGFRGCNKVENIDDFGVTMFQKSQNVPYYEYAEKDFFRTPEKHSEKLKDVKPPAMLSLDDIGSDFKFSPVFCKGSSGIKKNGNKYSLTSIVKDVTESQKTSDRHNKSMTAEFSMELVTPEMHKRETSRSSKMKYSIDRNSVTSNVEDVGRSEKISDRDSENVPAEFSLELVTPEIHNRKFKTPCIMLTSTPISVKENPGPLNHFMSPINEPLDETVKSVTQEMHSFEDDRNVEVPDNTMTTEYRKESHTLHSDFQNCAAGKSGDIAELLEEMERLEAEEARDWTLSNSQEETSNKVHVKEQGHGSDSKSDMSYDDDNEVSKYKEYDAYAVLQSVAIKLTELKENEIKENTIDKDGWERELEACNSTKTNNTNSLKQTSIPEQAHEETSSNYIDVNCQLENNKINANEITLHADKSLCNPTGIISPQNKIDLSTKEKVSIVRRQNSYLNDRKCTCSEAFVLKLSRETQTEIDVRNVGTETMNVTHISVGIQCDVMLNDKSNDSDNQVTCSQESFHSADKGVLCSQESFHSANSSVSIINQSKIDPCDKQGYQLRSRKKQLNSWAYSTTAILS